MKHGGLLAIVVLLATFGAVRTAPDIVQRIDPRLTAAAEEVVTDEGRTLHFTAVLTDPETGEPVTDTFDVHLSIWTESTAGTMLWEERQGGVFIDHGVINIRLGADNPLPASIFDGSPLWLEIQLNDDEPLKPRILMSRSASAFYSDTTADVECGTKPPDPEEEAPPEEEPRDAETADGCISDYELKDGSVGTEEIKDGSITGDDLGEGSVTGFHVADESLTGNDIRDGSLTTNDVADETLTGNDIKDGTIGTADVADNSITTNDVADETLTGNDIKDGTVGTNDVADNSLTTDDVADETLTGNDIKDGTVGTNDVADNSLTTDDVADGSLTGADIKDGTVSADDLGTNSVTTDELADNSVTTTEIADGTIGTDDIADGTVSTDDIADGTIGTDDIADGTIGTDDIADGTVSTADIADGSISVNDLGSDVLNLITAQPGGKPPYEVRTIAAGAVSVDTVIGVDGFPVIAFADGNGAVTFVHCSDTSCRNSTSSALTTDTNNTIDNVAVAIAPTGNPVLFSENETLLCANLLCTTSTSALRSWSFGEKMLDAAFGQNGLPVLVTTSGLRHCTTVQCDTDGTSSMSFAPSAFTIDPEGAVVVGAQYDTVSIARCTVDLGCQDVSFQVAGAVHAAVTLGADGLPVVGVLRYVEQYSYNQPGARELLTFHCTAVGCATRDAAVVTPLPGRPVSISGTQGADGQAVFTLTTTSLGAAPDGLTVARCGGEMCSRVALANAAAIGYASYSAGPSAITIGTDGNPFIATIGNSGAGEAVFGIHCSNRYCVPHYRQH